MEPILIILTLAALGEVVIEALNPLLRPVVDWMVARWESVEDEQVYLYLSTLIGLGLAFIYGADILLTIGLDPPNQAAVVFGQIATGLLLGRGSSVVHKAISRLTGVGGDETYLTAVLEETED